MDIIKLPMIGLSEESAIITEYYVKVGDRVAVGDNLFAIENGKATYDVPAEVSGYVLAILQEAGDEYPIETPVLAIGAQGEKYTPHEAASVPSGTESPVSVPETADQLKATGTVSESSAATPASTHKKDGAVNISPRAKKLARGHEIDFASLKATGPNGMIIERDVQAWLDQVPAPHKRVVEEKKPEEKKPVEIKKTTISHQDQKVSEGITYTDREMSGIRKIIADNMLASTSGLAQASMMISFDATNIQNLRKQFKLSADPDVRGIGLGDMIYYAVVHSVLAYPFFNAHFFGDRYIVREFDHVHLGVAVDTERGLMVPTVFNADTLSLREFSKEIKRLANGCREGTISPSELQGASLTVSNMGLVGAESFTPIVNPPQTTIVGICALQYRARPKEDSEFEFYPAIPLALTIDHRVSEGVPSGMFMMDICRKLENFTELLV